MCQHTKGPCVIELSCRMGTEFRLRAVRLDSGDLGRLAKQTREMLDAALCDSLGQWGVAVCSECQELPGAIIPDESFFDEIVRNTRKILMPAVRGMRWKAEFGRA